ncbi:DinB family protein [Luteipulveratus mongoliensis]|uniref:DinB-like domain-containing protein n=1 Tax=Luteipulveratus mongoliensis TaxID=571913 RepID=A0A0K1JMK5_9MICO|nr:DinB family protein [Luteipulveratus mongoliensis]AKU17946.1 hypothetical protein VV02_22240 [Luteipulveratus mongoliensis]
MDFDWTMLQRPTAMAMVRSQLGFSWLVLSGALDDLSDEEWAWEPAPGAWSVRRRDGAQPADHLVGAGEWVMEWPPDDGSDGRTRTIAWLIAHLTEAFFERYEHTFGGHEKRRDSVDFASNAQDAVAALTRQIDAWQQAIADLDEEQVFTVGLSQATEIDQAAPFGHLVLHMNRELIAHGAEISVLRDLYRARS